ESIAAALASDRWKALFDYGMFPGWIYAFRADDPRYLAEFRNGVMFLHVFNEVSDRDHYLDNQDLMFLDTVQPVTTDVMPERAKTDYGFTTYDGRPSSAEDG